VYAFTRENGNKKVLVILNLSPSQQVIRIADKSLMGPAYNVFKGAMDNVNSRPRQLKPWGYEVYEY
jgi:hypothetical protein